MRQAREERGISISEVAEQTRISPLYLKSIEKDDYKPLPGGIFNKGFVKSYARFIGYDENQALQEYGQLMAQLEGTTPEEQLRTYVFGYLPRIASSDDRTAWIHDLMRHETSEPTPLAPWIAEHGIMPRFEYLCGVVAKLLECKPTDKRVVRCVMSIMAQCLFFRPDRFRTAAFKGWPLSHADLAAVAEHIVEFSLAGIKRIAMRR